MDWNADIGRDGVLALYRVILGREAGNDPNVERLAGGGFTARHVLDLLLGSDEYAALHAHRRSLAPSAGSYVADAEFRSPSAMCVTPSTERTIVLVGHCLMDAWEPVLARQPDAPHVVRVTVNNGSTLPPLSAREAAGIDYQIGQLPLREIMLDGLLLGLRADDDMGYNAAFGIACERMSYYLDASLDYHRQFGTTMFMLNFTLPQQNALGRLAPRYALSNPVHFVERLNEQLAAMLADRPGAYFVDYDQIVATFGRRHVQDDAVTHISHAANLASIMIEIDHARLEKGPDVGALYAPKVAEFITATYTEIEGLYRTVRQLDSIKLVIFDLDDTMWRGVSADSDASIEDMREGWPLGLVEAASYLWRRGILLAIASKRGGCRHRDMGQTIRQGVSHRELRRHSHKLAFQGGECCRYPVRPKPSTPECPVRGRQSGRARGGEKRFPHDPDD